MKLHVLSASEFWKAVGLGIANALLLSVIVVPVIRSGISPLPKPPSLAFAETLFQRDLPLVVGLLFHIAYVTFWSVVYVSLFRDRLTFLNALWLALVLWVIALVIFFPIIGWGFLGLGVSPRIIVAALIPHVLFAVFLWALCHYGFPQHIPEGVSNPRPR